jgi:hypothetical protein
MLADFSRVAASRTEQTDVDLVTFFAEMAIFALLYEGNKRTAAQTPGGGSALQRPCAEALRHLQLSTAPTRRCPVRSKRLRRFGSEVLCFLSSFAKNRPNVMFVYKTDFGLQY